jgi:hypothetical protein
MVIGLPSMENVRSSICPPHPLFVQNAPLHKKSSQIESFCAKPLWGETGPASPTGPGRASGGEDTAGEPGVSRTG